MTKKTTEAGRTHIMFVLDKSQSMSSVRNAVVDGFNKMLAEQRENKSPCSVSLVQFDDKYEENYLDMPLADVPMLSALTYEPRGNTALYDALGRAITSLGTRLDKLAANERPDRVIVIVHTDGQENASKETTAEQVRTLVKEQQQEAGWLFVFAGANIDAFHAGRGIGVMSNATANYMGHSAPAVGALYTSTSAAVRRGREMPSAGYKSIVRGEVDFFNKAEVHAMATGDSSLLGGQASVGGVVGVSALDSVPAIAPVKRSMAAKSAPPSRKKK